MRLFLLPISTRRALIYCERRIAHEAATLAPNGKEPPPAAPPPAAGGPPKRNLVDRITHKANETWTQWEAADGGWKKALTTYGNKMLTRIPFEEWGLKTVPPLGARHRRKRDEGGGAGHVDVLFPRGFLPESSVLARLRSIATERQALHRRRMWWSVVGMPLVAPFALVPVIPNIPFFYLVFRAWSHYKALYGSKHLEFLLQNNMIRPSPSPILDEMYAAGLLHSSRQQSRDAPSPTQEQIEKVAAGIEHGSDGGGEEKMLLQRWNGKLIAERFKIPSMEIEIERAVEQVERSLKAKKELQEEKQAVEKASDSRPVGNVKDSAKR